MKQLKTIKSYQIHNYIIKLSNSNNRNSSMQIDHRILNQSQSIIQMKIIYCFNKTIKKKIN